MLHYKLEFLPPLNEMKDTHDKNTDDKIASFFLHSTVALSQSARWLTI